MPRPTHARPRAECVSLEVAADHKRLAGAVPPVGWAAPTPWWSTPPRPHIADRGGPSRPETRCCCHNRHRPAPAGGAASRPAAHRSTPAPTPAWYETPLAPAPVLGGSGRDPRSTPVADTT